MKAWKNEIVEALNKKAKSMREISFKEVANELGYNHVKTQEVDEIVRAFIKQNPTYRALKFVNPKKTEASQSLFTTLMLSDAEYQTKEEFEKEMGLK